MKNKICVGLDLNYISEPINYFNIINQTKDIAYCYKINPAFFLNDFSKIVKITDYLNSNNLKWIYDAKFCDVTHTNRFYAKLTYEKLNAWGATLNPYLGIEAIKPFIKYKDKQNFILCRTSNEGSELIQHSVYKKVYEIVNNNSLNLVIAANKENYLNDALLNCKNSLILSPGIGAQGGKIEINNDRIIYNISRSIINNKNPRKELQKYVSQLSSD